MSITNDFTKYTILAAILWLTGCASKRALVLENKVGPTVELRGVKRGVFLTHGAPGSERIEWQVVFRFTSWQRRYSISSQTPVEMTGIAPRFHQGQISLSENNNAVDVNLRVRTERGSQPWDQNGRYLVEKY